METFRPSMDSFERIDDKSFSGGVMKDHFLQNHAVHDTLAGQNRVEIYEVYKSRSSNELISIVKFGGSMNGFPGVVHGGIAATIFDNAFNWLVITLNLPASFTANLNVNYR